MAQDDSTARVPLGPIGSYVMQNLRELRQARGLGYKELSAALHELGRDIPALGLSRIEKGTRRVDADDLVGLALALGVNPSALLLPKTVRPRDLINLTACQQELASDAWAWADGERPLPEAGPGTRSNMDLYALADFARQARPLWAPPLLLRQLQGEESGNDAEEQ
jgi:transcriptional regulator with XRE-family HTH domain